MKLFFSPVILLLAAIGVSKILIKKGDGCTKPSDICKACRLYPVMATAKNLCSLTKLLERDCIPSAYVCGWNGQRGDYVVRPNGSVTPFDKNVNNTCYAFCTDRYCPPKKDECYEEIRPCYEEKTQGYDTYLECNPDYCDQGKEDYGGYEHKLDYDICGDDGKYDECQQIVPDRRYEPCYQYDPECHDDVKYSPPNDYCPEPCETINPCYTKVPDYKPVQQRDECYPTYDQRGCCYCGIEVVRLYVFDRNCIYVDRCIRVKEVDCCHHKQSRIILVKRDNCLDTQVPYPIRFPYILECLIKYFAKQYCDPCPCLYTNCEGKLFVKVNGKFYYIHIERKTVYCGRVEFKVCPISEREMKCYAKAGLYGIMFCGVRC